MIFPVPPPMPIGNGFKNGKSMIMLPPPPPSPEKLSPSANTSILDDFSLLPPPPPPIAIDIKNSPKKQSACQAISSPKSTPLSATDMLEKSLRNLQASENEEFRTNAGKVISLMLESRLTDKNGGSSTIVETMDVDNNQTPTKLIQEVGKNKQNGRDGTTSIQMIVPQTTMIETKTNQNNGKFIVSTTLPVVTISSNPATNNESLSFAQSMLKNDADGFVKRNGSKLHEDHHLADTVSINGNHTNNGGIVFRNKESKLTSHARDRRSYIEKDQQVINKDNNNSINSCNDDNDDDDVVVVSTNNNNNNNRNNKNSSNTTTVIAVGTTDKASELVDGKQPVCSCCNTKITR